MCHMHLSMQYRVNLTYHLHWGEVGPGTRGHSVCKVQSGGLTVDVREADKDGMCSSTDNHRGQ